MARRAGIHRAIRQRVRLLLLFMLSSCAVGFGAQVGFTVDTKGRLSVGAHAMTRTGFWTARDPASEGVAYWFPQLTAGAAWELSTSSLRIDAGVPSVGWARYTSDAWEPSVQLVAPQLSARLSHRGISELRACAGVAGTYERSVRYLDHDDTSSIKRIDHTVGPVGELDLCWSKLDGVFGAVSGGVGYELVLFQ